MEGYFTLLKKEPFFVDINWDELEKRNVVPPYNYEAMKEAILGGRIHVPTKHLCDKKRMVPVIDDFWNFKAIEKPLRACNYYGDIFEQTDDVRRQNRKIEPINRGNNRWKIEINNKVHLSLYWLFYMFI